MTSKVIIGYKLGKGPKEQDFNLLNRSLIELLDIILKLIGTLFITVLDEYRKVETNVLKIARRLARE